MLQRCKISFFCCNITTFFDTIFSFYDGIYVDQLMSYLQKPYYVLINIIGCWHRSTQHILSGNNNVIPSIYTGYSLI